MADAEVYFDRAVCPVVERPSAVDRRSISAASGVSTSPAGGQSTPDQPSWVTPVSAPPAAGWSVLIGPKVLEQRSMPGPYAGQGIGAFATLGDPDGNIVGLFKEAT